MSQEKRLNNGEVKDTEVPDFLIAIPCNSTDEHVDRALLSYSCIQQDELNQMQFVILVEGEHAEKSKAADKIEAFIKSNPHINIRVWYKDNSVARDIAEIRRDLLNLVDEDREMADKGNILVLSQDPSLRQIQPGFLDAVRRHFIDPNVTMLTGFVDYSAEAFDQNHYLLALQIITDVLEEKWRQKVGILARGANAAFRLKAIKDANFYHAFDPSSRQKFAHKREPFPIISDDEEMGVVLSAQALMDEHPGAKQEDAKKITSDHFPRQLEEGLNGLYRSLLARNSEIDAGNLLFDVAKECGVQVCIAEQAVQVLDISDLRERILSQWSRF